MLIEILQLVLYDAIFIGLFLVALLPLAMYKRAAAAVLKRNFFGYFSNPTGYVFLCIFVLLTSFFAFWPHEFFNSNLANVDQLNDVIPLILLIFVPAITMSVWAEERRQGTDELLLTLPAGDFDIVTGKFLAAASIFSVSLLFSQIANYLVLTALSLGNLDTGLFFATYLGYWMMGLGMLAVGMVASFLTSNLTVGFILGVLFNVPLALASRADLMFTDTEIARAVQAWSLGAQFDDFGRGVISLSSGIYFLLIVSIGLYCSMVLIGKRHWYGGRDGDSMLVHYIVRALALLVMGAGLTYGFSNWDRIRYDATENKSASLSPQTIEIISKLDVERPIQIEAFISSNIPELYVQTRYDLVSLLKEFEKASSKVQVTIHDNLELSTDEAVLAEDRFGIRPRTVNIRSRGAIREEQVILGAVFQSGLQKVVVPFFENGIPVEYELVRSVATVAKQRKLKLGVIQTDAHMMGTVTFSGGRPQQIPKQPIIVELEKQYDVETVDPAAPINVDNYDALLAAQPSSLSPEGLSNLINAIKAGAPTVIFEDPRPWFLQHIPGTGDPKPSPGGMPGMNRNVPKADIQELWKALGIRGLGSAGFDGSIQPDLVWQRYNPYPKLQVESAIPDQWIFASNNAPEGEGSISDESQVTSGLVEVLFPVAGAITKRPESKLDFLPLIQTGLQSGTITGEAFMRAQRNRDPNELRNAQGAITEDRYTLAAHITAKGSSTADDEAEAADDGEANEDESGDGKLNVIYIADIDVLSSAFLNIRARPDQSEEIVWNFENVTFLLNVFDELTGDTDYIQIRKRKPSHYTLRVVEINADKAREQEQIERARYQKEFQEELDKREEEINEKVNKLQKELNDLQNDPQADRAELQYILQRHLIETERANRQINVLREQLERKRDRQIRNIRREADSKISAIQNQFKLYAILLPPLPPLLLGVLVLVMRLLREREGVAKTRLR